MRLQAGVLLEGSCRLLDIERLRAEICAVQNSQPVKSSAARISASFPRWPWRPPLDVWRYSFGLPEGFSGSLVGEDIQPLVDHAALYRRELGVPCTARSSIASSRARLKGIFSPVP